MARALKSVEELDNDLLPPDGAEPPTAEDAAEEAAAAARIETVTPPTDGDAWVAEPAPGAPEASEEPDDDEEDDAETISDDERRRQEWRLAEAEAEADERTTAFKMGATLQDVKVSRKSNGNDFWLTYEVGIEHAANLALAMKGGHDATWKQLMLGAGATVRTFNVKRDADGGAHLRVNLSLPQSEISRSAGRLCVMVGQIGVLVLEPMQGTLGLDDGRKVDLTARA